MIKWDVSQKHHILFYNIFYFSTPFIFQLFFSLCTQVFRLIEGTPSYAAQMYYS